ncbi:MAG: HipA N-terminal domain-containing protein [Thiohalomonas sp.]|nr:HipA N-terminal domain-containing protein [Thiohalomonas sp.]
MKDSFNVKVYDNTVAELVCENSEFIFKYQSEDKEDFISLTMPVRAKHYIHNQLHPIFKMHLPEGYLLSIIKKHFPKIAKTDDFSLLRLISGAIRGRINYEHGDFKHQDSLDFRGTFTPEI